MTPVDPAHPPHLPYDERMRCPLILRPAPQCYCYESTSANIEAMIRYCGGEYRDCRIYMNYFPYPAPKGDNLE